MLVDTCRCCRVAGSKAGWVACTPAGRTTRLKERVKTQTPAAEELREDVRLLE